MNIDEENPCSHPTVNTTVTAVGTREEWTREEHPLPQMAKHEEEEEEMLMEKESSSRCLHPGMMVRLKDKAHNSGMANDTDSDGGHADENKQTRGGTVADGTAMGSRSSRRLAGEGRCEGVMGCVFVPDRLRWWRLHRLQERVELLKYLGRKIPVAASPASEQDTTTPSATASRRDSKKQRRRRSRRAVSMPLPIRMSMWAPNPSAPLSSASGISAAAPTSHRRTSGMAMLHDPLSLRSMVTPTPPPELFTHPSALVTEFNDPACLGLFAGGLKPEQVHRVCAESGGLGFITVPDVDAPRKDEQGAVVPALHIGLRRRNVQRELPPCSRLVGTTPLLKAHPSEMFSGMTKLMPFEDFFYREQLRCFRSTAVASYNDPHGKAPGEEEDWRTAKLPPKGCFAADCPAASAAFRRASSVPPLPLDYRDIFPSRCSAGKRVIEDDVSTPGHQPRMRRVPDPVRVVAPPTSSRHRCVPVDSIQQCFVFNPLLDRIGAGAYSKVYAALPVLKGASICDRGFNTTHQHHNKQKGCAATWRGSHAVDLLSTPVSPTVATTQPVALKIISRSTHSKAVATSSHRTLNDSDVHPESFNKSFCCDPRERDREEEEAMRREKMELQEVEREIKLLRRLRHSGCARYLGALRTPEEYAIAMELHPGSLNAREYLQRYGPPSERRTALLVFQLASTLAYLHERFGVLHRDIKLENVVISSLADSTTGVAGLKESRGPHDRGISPELIATVLKESTSANRTGKKAARQNSQIRTTSMHNKEENSTHMLRATIIDFGLARSIPVPQAGSYPSTSPHSVFNRVVHSSSNNGCGGHAPNTYTSSVNTDRTRADLDKATGTDVNAALLRTSKSGAMAPFPSHTGNRFGTHNAALPRIAILGGGVKSPNTLRTSNTFTYAGSMNALQGLPSPAASVTQFLTSTYDAEVFLQSSCGLDAKTSNSNAANRLHDKAISRVGSLTNLTEDATEASTRFFLAVDATGGATGMHHADSHTSPFSNASNTRDDEGQTSQPQQEVAKEENRRIAGAPFPGTPRHPAMPVQQQGYDVWEHGAESSEMSEDQSTTTNAEHSDGDDEWWGKRCTARGGHSHGIEEGLKTNHMLMGSSPLTMVMGVSPLPIVEMLGAEESNVGKDEQHTHTNGLLNTSMHEGSHPLGPSSPLLPFCFSTGSECGSSPRLPAVSTFGGLSYRSGQEVSLPCHAMDASQPFPHLEKQNIGNVAENRVVAVTESDATLACLGRSPTLAKTPSVFLTESSSPLSNPAPSPPLPMLLLTPCGTERYLPPEMLEWMLSCSEEDTKATTAEGGSTDEVTPQGRKRSASVQQAKQMDIYALGMVTHVLLTGYFPFDATSRAGQLQQQQAGARCNSEHWKGVSSEAIHFVKWLLHPDPAQRCSSALEALKHPFLRHSRRHAVKLGLVPRADGEEEEEEDDATEVEEQSSWRCFVGQDESSRGGKEGDLNTEVPCCAKTSPATAKQHTNWSTLSSFSWNASRFLAMPGAAPQSATTTPRPSEVPTRRCTAELSFSSTRPTAMASPQECSEPHRAPTSLRTPVWNSTAIGPSPITTAVVPRNTNNNDDEEDLFDQLYAEMVTGSLKT